jgi:hypothetical protein
VLVDGKKHQVLHYYDHYKGLYPNSHPSTMLVDGKKHQV